MTQQWKSNAFLKRICGTIGCTWYLVVWYEICIWANDVEICTALIFIWGRYLVLYVRQFIRFAITYNARNTQDAQTARLLHIRIPSKLFNIHKITKFDFENVRITITNAWLHSLYPIPELTIYRKKCPQISKAARNKGWYIGLFSLRLRNSHSCSPCVGLALSKPIHSDKSCEIQIQTECYHKF